MFNLVDVSITAGIGATAGGLFHLATKTYFTEKIVQSIKHEYDTKLSELNGEIARNQMILQTVLSSQHQNHEAGQSERLVAIKSFWLEYVLIRDALKDYITLFDILKEDQYPLMNVKPRSEISVVKNALNSLSTEKLLSIGKSYENIESNRPFLNENIWLNVTYLQAFWCRIIAMYNLREGATKVQHWRKDSELLRIAKEALNDEEYRFVFSAETDTLKAFRNFIEQKIMVEIQNIITGHVASENTYKRAMELVKLDKQER